MEYSMSAFSERLRELMYNRFPYENDAMKLFKHAKTPLHIRDIALGTPHQVGDTIVFEIGNDYAEENYPYYHILQDAPYIRKRDRGTAKTKGSQAKVEKLSERNYNLISFNGKTYSREYTRNVRGSRKRLSSVSHWATDFNGDKIWINRDSNSYLNVHYHYIDKMLNNTIVDQLAMEFGMKTSRVELTSIESDYATQEHENLVMGIIRSLTEE